MVLPKLSKVTWELCIGVDNELALNKRLTIILTNDGLVYWRIYASSRSSRPRWVIIPSASTKLKGGILVSHCPSVRLSVCGQNRVRSVSSTILVGSISYLHILSSNLRRCVTCKVCFKTKKRNFGEFFKLVTLTLSSFDLGSNMTQ